MTDAGAPMDFASFRARIESPSLRALADHWDKVRGRRRMPSWAHLKTSALEPHMTKIWAFNYDRSSGEFGGRFAGSAIMVDLARASWAYRCASSILPLSSRPPRPFARTVSEPACARWSGKLFKVGDQIIEGERICLPMSRAAEHADGVLGASSYDYPVLRTPDRLELIHDIADWCKV